MTSTISAIVPTLGRSPYLEACLEALRRSGRGKLEILLVVQGGDPGSMARALADRVLRLERNRGFAAANNLALGESRGALVATVNDDAVVEEDWVEILAGALAEEPGAAAAQGVNLVLDRPERVDGCGLGWTRAWQAVQLGRGEDEAAWGEGGPREIFGVSATAALYRREALATAGPRPFDERLFAYYEDVDLALRLRARGWSALLVPAARTRHAGSASWGVAGSRRFVYGNRHLVLARALGRAYWPLLPRLLARDLADLVGAAVRGELTAASSIAAGWGRALGRLGGFAHFRPPSPPLAELRRFRVDR